MEATKSMLKQNGYESDDEGYNNLKWFLYLSEFQPPKNTCSGEMREDETQGKTDSSHTNQMHRKGQGER